MSDLIARLASMPIESSGYELWLSCREAATALRQKEAEASERETLMSQRVNQANERAEIAEAQLSALRDQPPVAWRLRRDGVGRWFTDNEKAARDYANDFPDVEIYPLVYAHPSCVSPDKPQQQQDDTSGVASDQSKRPAGSHESAGDPVE